MQDIEKYEAAAYELGVEHARNAASWIIDGNTPESTVSALLEDLLDGDPEVYDFLPRMPDLSGEYANDMTPIGLYEEITGESHGIEEERAGLAYETLVGSVIDALCNAYEAGVSDTFGVECERILRAALVTS